MGKRTFSEIVATVIRNQKAPNLNRSGSRRTFASLASIQTHHLEEATRLDLQNMPPGAAGSPVDDLMKSAISSDSIWPSDRVLQRNNDVQNSEPASPRSATFRSKPDLANGLTSPTTTQLFVQSLASASPQSRLDRQCSNQDTANTVFFLRSDADSLKDTPSSPTYTTSDQDPPTPPPGSDLQALAASPVPIGRSNTSAIHHPWADATSNAAVLPPPHFPCSPSPEVEVSEPAVQPAIRLARPTLTRLKTSELLPPHSTKALEPEQSRPVASRKSPTGLKLQLDTAVPRRSSALTSFPHHVKSRQKSMLQAPLSLLTSTTAARNPQSGSTRAAKPSRRPGTANGFDQHRSRTDLRPDEFDFEVSTILPNFLYLGPNIQTEQNVSELRDMGVRRILNVAYEIDDSGPLQLSSQFDKYLKLPMLDSVEAQGVQESIKEACQFLDDARLRSEPVYVHCKAGKSRSVTIVIAYLIHALRWSLQRSYSHVAEKRSAISPNIGFVAELMRYEERELNVPRSSGIYGNFAVPSQSPISKSSPTLLSSSDNLKGAASQHSNDMVPPLSMHTLQMQASSGPDAVIGPPLSKSSPDLASLTFRSR